MATRRDTEGDTPRQNNMVEQMRLVDTIIEKHIQASEEEPEIELFLPMFKWNPKVIRQLLQIAIGDEAAKEFEDGIKKMTKGE
jgi:hypothetical protein